MGHIVMDMDMTVMMTGYGENYGHGDGNGTTDGDGNEVDTCWETHQERMDTLTNAWNTRTGRIQSALGQMMGMTMVVEMELVMEMAEHH